MITENLSTLKIHKLSQAQYDRALEAGRIDENALYLTPDEEIDLSNYATIEQLNTKADAVHTHAGLGCINVFHNDMTNFSCDQTYGYVQENLLEGMSVLGIFTDTANGVVEQLYAELHDQDGEIWFVSSHGGYVFYDGGNYVEDHWEYDPKLGSGSEVLYTEQYLTDEQKAQARNNIGITGTGKDGEDGYSVLTVNVRGSNYSNIQISRFSSTPKVGDLAITNDGYLFKITNKMIETLTCGVELVADLNGKTPVKGTDYFTDADKEEIVQQTLEEITGLPAVTEADNGKVLMVVNGKWALVNLNLTVDENGVVSV